MKISYAITVCNKIEEIKRLISFLIKHKREEDEIVIQMDVDPLDLNDLDLLKKEVLGYIMSEQESHRIRVIFHPLNKSDRKLVGQVQP